MCLLLRSDRGWLVLLLLQRREKLDERTVPVFRESFRPGSRSVAKPFAE
jgi:hypothetical protein